jgi:hypothetical protein
MFDPSSFKYHPGKEFYRLLWSDSVRSIDCDICEAKGYVELKNIKWNCPKCNGSTVIYMPGWFIDKVVITQIVINEAFDVVYMIGDDHYIGGTRKLEHNKDTYFETEAEAQKRADEKNAAGLDPEGRKHEIYYAYNMWQEPSAAACEKSTAPMPYPMTTALKDTP